MPYKDPAKEKACKAKWQKDNREYCNSYARQWAKENPETIWACHIWQRYKITPAQYWQLVADQKGLCPCGEPLDFSGEKPDVEHDHETGKVRGVAHAKCNSGIGLLGDDPVKLRKLAEYLENSKDKT